MFPKMPPNMTSQDTDLSSPTTKLPKYNQRPRNPFSRPLTHREQISKIKLARKYHLQELRRAPPPAKRDTKMKEWVNFHKQMLLDLERERESRVANKMALMQRLNPIFERNESLCRNEEEIAHVQAEAAKLRKHIERLEGKAAKLRQSRSLIFRQRLANKIEATRLQFLPFVPAELTQEQVNEGRRRMAELLEPLNKHVTEKKEGLQRLVEVAEGIDGMERGEARGARGAAKAREWRGTVEGSVVELGTVAQDLGEGKGDAGFE